MKLHSQRNKQPKRDDLDCQSSDENVVPGCEVATVGNSLCNYGGAACLHYECNDIAYDKNVGEPRRRDSKD